MKLNIYLHVLVGAILLSTGLVSCTSAQHEALLLASFTENYVDVLIHLERDSEAAYVLSATFTPPEGYHLYSKDIPIHGVNGLGRPTLLELPPDSQIKARSGLTESVKAQIPDFEPKQLLVYPLGAVTLSLPIELPPGDGWSEAEVQVTYMACSASQCKPPVVARHVLVAIPSVDILNEE